MLSGEAGRKDVDPPVAFVKHVKTMRFPAIVLAALPLATLPGACQKCADVAKDPETATPAANTSTTFTLDCKAKAKPISPLIYGIGFDITGDTDWKEPRQWELNPTGRRLGGNASTRYNWEHGQAFNHASDWMFKNNAGSEPEPFYVTFMRDNAEKGVTAVVQIPMIGWVAKDGTSASFPIAEFGGQEKTDNEVTNGNGKRRDGTEIAPPPPTRTSKPSTPEFQAKFVQRIKTLASGFKHKEKRIYLLDNEPALWNSTHRDVHPEPVTYDELLDRTKKYATAIRDADPEGLIAGPTAFGWSELFYSAKDLKGRVNVPGGAPDRKAHEDMPLVAWYLRELKAHEVKTGKKLLDLLDVHYYPQTEGIGVGKEGKVDAETSAIRIRSPRALWDPTYKDESWIKDTVRLIPRLQEWIDKYYPGLGIQIGEWNFGAEGDISSGLATAEALGRFADGGVRSAYYWVYPVLDSPAFFAFRAFRNFDGKNGRFLDNLVPAKGVDGTSIWASRDDAGKHVVLVVINTSPFRNVTAPIEVGSCGTVKSARAFVYTKANKGFKESEPKAGGASLSVEFPPYSISVVDVNLM